MVVTEDAPVVKGGAVEGRDSIRTPELETEHRRAQSPAVGTHGPLEQVAHSFGRATGEAETIEEALSQERRWYAYFTTKEFYLILLLGSVVNDLN